MTTRLSGDPLPALIIKNAKKIVGAKFLPIDPSHKHLQHLNSVVFLSLQRTKIICPVATGQSAYKYTQNYRIIRKT